MRPAVGRLALFGLIAVLATAGCSGHAGTATPVRSIALAPVKARTTQSPFASLLRHSRDLGPLPARDRVTFLVLLRNPSARQQQAALAAVSDPSSPRYGQYLTPAQWSARYRLPTAAVDVAIRHLRRLGVSAVWQPGSDTMQVGGPTGRLSRVFGIGVHLYQATGGERFWASARDPRTPAWLRPLVAGTGHVSSYGLSRLRPTLRPARLVPVDGLTPADTLTIYDIRPLRQAGFDGTGQTVAFIEIDGYHQKDLDAFTKHFGLPAMHPQIKYGSRLSGVSGETELDMEVVHEIAPGAHLLLYNCSADCSSSDISTVEQHAVRDNPHAVISVSLGGCEQVEGSVDANAERSAFDQSVAQGESVLVASGDSGAFECLTENWGAPPGTQYIGLSCPACVPNVTAVGGTHVSLNANGTWYREESWEDPPGTAGTGGGVSTLFARPSWQTGPGTDSSFNANNARMVPDVAADADPLTSISINVNGSFVQVGGTSQAAPIWAGITTLMNQYLESKGHSSLGFLNPALYRLAATSQKYPPFHDVTTGTNLVYPAGPGYDLATGLGTPDAWNLVRDLAALKK